MKHLKQIRYLFLHKLYVWQAGRKLGLGWFQLLIHDWQKFTRSEWMPYANKFFWNAGPELKAIIQYEFLMAWNHHLKAGGKHHWQYWIIPGKYPTYLEIPDKYIREMVADWSGAGKAITGKDDPREWYAGQINHGKIRISTETQIRVTELMKEVWG